jgi:gag-polyprotein putative aspartyl protease
MRGSFILAGALAATLAASGAAAQSRCKFVRVVEWPVRLERGQIVFDGAINGKKVGIVIDTGTGASMILRSSAERLDLPRHEFRGGGVMLGLGERRVETAVVDEFKLGDASTTSITFYVAGEREFAEGEDVLLGQDFLRKFVEFDLANRAVRLFAPKDCERASLAYWTKQTAGEVELDPLVSWPYRMRYINGAQPMVLGVDFLRAHRTLVSHSQHRMYFTYIGGPVFAASTPQQ